MAANVGSRHGAQRVACFALATTIAMLCVVAAATSRDEKIILDLKRRTLGASAGTAMQHTIAGKTNMAKIIQMKKGSSAPMLREPVEKVTNPPRKTTTRIVSSPKPHPSQQTSENVRCDKSGGSPPNKLVKRNCMKGSFEWKDHTFYPAVNCRRVGPPVDGKVPETFDDYKEMKRAKVKKKQYAIAEMKQKIKKMRKRIKQRSEENIKWRNRKGKGTWRNKKGQTNYNFNDIRQHLKYKKLKLALEETTDEFEKVKNEMRMLKAQYNGMNVQCRLHKNSYADTLEHDLNKANVLPLTRLLEWGKITATGGNTVYKYDCQKKLQKKSGLCKLLTDPHYKCEEKVYGMYGTFAADKTSLAESGWSYVTISIHCNGGEMFYSLDRGKSAFFNKKVEKVAKSLPKNQQKGRHSRRAKKNPRRRGRSQVRSISKRRKRSWRKKSADKGKVGKKYWRKICGKNKKCWRKKKGKRRALLAAKTHRSEC